MYLRITCEYADKKAVAIKVSDVSIALQFHLVVRFFVLDYYPLRNDILLSILLATWGI